MSVLPRFALSIAFLGLAGCGEVGGGPVVADAYGYLPLTGGGPAVAYFVVRNAGDEELVLRAFESPLFERAELHETTVEDGVARMRRLGSLVVPARGEARLEPGGAHLMLLGPKGALENGAVCPVTATFADSSSLSFDVVLGLRGSPSAPEADS